MPRSPPLSRLPRSLGPLKRPAPRRAEGGCCPCERKEMCRFQEQGREWHQLSCRSHSTEARRGQIRRAGAAAGPATRPPRGPASSRTAMPTPCVMKDTESTVFRDPEWTTPQARPPRGPASSRPAMPTPCPRVMHAGRRAAATTIRVQRRPKSIRVERRPPSLRVERRQPFTRALYASSRTAQGRTLRGNGGRAPGRGQ